MGKKLTEEEKLKWEIKRIKEIKKNRWPEDPMVWKRYTLRCQKCKERLPLEIRFVNEKMKKAFLLPCEEYFFVNIPTKQFKIATKRKPSFGEEMNSWPSGMYIANQRIINDLSFESTPKIALTRYWSANKKRYVKLLYSLSNGLGDKKGILCDKCYELEKLKE